MPNKCWNRRTHKGGNCLSCNCCILCKAPDHCQEKHKHRGKKKKRGNSPTLGQPSISHQPTSKRKIETVCQVIELRKQGQRKCKEVANASIGLQKKQEQQDEIATIMPIPTISAGEEFTSMTSKERMEHINSRDSNVLFPSKIEYARQETFNEAKQSVVDTNGRDLDLSAEFFIEALRARAKSYSPKDKLKIISVVLELYEGTMIEDLCHDTCIGWISSGNVQETLDRKSRRQTRIINTLVQGIITSYLTAFFVYSID